jgi:NitT/TauT family transport system substrate-binding protein
MKGFRSGIGRLAACAAVATMAWAAQAPAVAQDTINVLLPNENTTTLYPAIVARELGFYDDEGIEVTLLASDTTIPYMAFLANSQADLSMFDAPQTFQALNADQPIKVIFEGMQSAPEMVFVKADSDAQTLEDLLGTTVGLASDRDQITLQVALDAVGHTIDEVSTVVVGDAGPVLASSLRDDKVSAVAAAVNDATVVAANGIPYRDVTPPAVKKNPANSFVIYAPRVEELRPVVTKFLRAWAKGAEAANIDRDAVAAMCAKSVPEEWENAEAGNALLDAAMGMILPQTPQHGQPQPDVWTAIQGPYIKFGVIEGEVDPAGFLDESFYEEANAFDSADVQAAIDKWKEMNP